MTHGDGTWCSKCNAPYHTDCIAEGSSCGKCGTLWTPPQQNFFYSDLCPVCPRPNSPPAQNCRHCGTITHWDNEGAYVKRRSGVRSWGKKQLLLGIGLIAVSTALALLLFGVATVALAFIAIPAGVLRVRAGIRACEFH